MISAKLRASAECCEATTIFAKARRSSGGRPVGDKDVDEGEIAEAHRHGLDAVLVVGDGSEPLPTDCDVVGIAGPRAPRAGPPSTSWSAPNWGRSPRPTRKC
ncbi:hypothetical protein [Streptomyces axinellae]|uniref:hypothetical protein n=1 Tax=Streptomyces axinellae TaxID=552788 RepID=UPI0031D924FC